MCQETETVQDMRKIDRPANLIRAIKERFERYPEADEEHGAQRSSCVMKNKFVGPH